MHGHTHLHGCYTLTALAMLAVLGGETRLEAQVGLGIAPMRVELNVPSGTQRSGSVSVSNNSPSPVRVRAQLLDFYIDAEDTPQFAPSWPKEEDGSCRGWLSLNPVEIELNAGEQIQVRYTLRIPDTAKLGSHHCAVGFTTMPTANTAEPSGLRMAVRVVAAFYAVVGLPSLEGGVKEMRLEPTGGTRQGIVVVENRGDFYFRATGELSVLDADGRLIESEPFLGIPILPRREQRFFFAFKTSLSPGRYLLRSRIDIGANEIQEAVTPVVVEPPKP